MSPACSAPDIAGKNIANPLATILSVAMMMRYTFAREDIAQRIETAVRKTLQSGLRTGDIYEAGMQKVGTDAMAMQWHRPCNILIILNKF